MERETIRALLVDDDQGDFVMTRALLDQIERPTIELDWVSTFEEGRAALERDDYDVFIVDYFLEDRTGLDLLREAGRRQLQAPVIMLTGRGSHDVDLDAMRAGAADYLIKGQIEPEDLERSIRYALDRVESLRALRESEERHRGCSTTFRWAYTDALRVVTSSTPTRPSLESSATPIRSPSTERMRPRSTSRKVTASTSGPDWSSSGLCAVSRLISVVSTGGISGLGTLHASTETPTVRWTISRVVIEDVSAAWRTGGFYQDAARFQAMYNHGGIRMIILDFSGEVQDVSPAFCSLSGRDEDDLLSIHYSELWVEEDQEKVAAEIRPLGEGGEEHSEHTRNLKMKDGSLRAVSVITALVRDWDGEPDHIVVLIEELSGSGKGH